MPTNTYFNNFNSNPEQNLFEDLIIESIKIYGMDMYYLPRSFVNLDNIFGEDRSSEFNKALPIEMYIKSVDGFAGDMDLMSKFGLQVRDELTLTVAKRRFRQLQLSEEYDRDKAPKEGDLVYFPLNDSLFEIKFVQDEAIFYQAGKLMVFDLVCELFEYNDEDINTGVAEIDDIEYRYSYAVEFGYQAVANTSSVVLGDLVTGSFGGYVGEVSYLNPITNRIKLINVTGTFANGEIITTSSGTGVQLIDITPTETVQTFDANDDEADNQPVQIVSDNIVDFTESNPFSESDF